MRFSQVQTAGVIVVLLGIILRVFVLDDSVNPQLVQFINYAFILLLVVIISLQIEWYRR